MSTYLITRPTRTGSGPVLRRPVALAPRRAIVPAVPVTPVTVTRDGEDGLVTVEAPGLDPTTDLSVTITGGRLTVAGVRRSTAGATRREARFSRTLTLPEGVGQDAVSADYSAGVLRVRVAGMLPAPVQPETRTVAITSDVKPSEVSTPTTGEAVDGDQGGVEQDAPVEPTGIDQAPAPAAA